jgi:hypothetical protein
MYKWDIATMRDVYMYNTYFLVGRSHIYMSFAYWTCSAFPYGCYQDGSVSWFVKVTYIPCTENIQPYKPETVPLMYPKLLPFGKGRPALGNFRTLGNI